VESNLEICTEQDPELLEIEPSHQVRCWLYSQDEDHSDG
jgi:hypothetical protein